MAALTQARGFTPRNIKYLQFVLDNGVTAFPGAAMFYNPATGNATIGSANPALKYLGRCAEDVAPIIGLGTNATLVNVDLDQEISLTYFSNGTSTDAVLVSDFGAPVYSLDDQTVSRIPSGKPCVGYVFEVNSIKGVGVSKEPIFGTVPVLSPVVALAAFVANATAPAAAALVSGAIHDVPATGAASTITLPAASPDGTVLYFRADGIKNTATVQYLDATGAVALTTALLANKRHLVVAAKLGTVWTANAYVSP